MNEARATQALVRRGFLQKTKGATPLVTPEGLAALMDSVPCLRPEERKEYGRTP